MKQIEFTLRGDTKVSSPIRLTSGKIAVKLSFDGDDGHNFVSILMSSTDEDYVAYRSYPRVGTSFEMNITDLFKGQNIIINTSANLKSGSYFELEESTGGGMSEEDRKKLERYEGKNEVDTLSNLPTDKRLIIATLSQATDLSVSEMKAGEEIYIVGVATKAFTQPLPDSGGYTAMNGNSIEVKEHDVFEISIICTDENKYTLMFKQKE